MGRTSKIKRVQAQSCTVEVRLQDLSKLAKGSYPSNLQTTVESHTLHVPHQTKAGCSGKSSHTDKATHQKMTLHSTSSYNVPHAFCSMQPFQHSPLPILFGSDFKMAVLVTPSDDSCRDLNW